MKGTMDYRSKLCQYKKELMDNSPQEFKFGEDCDETNEEQKEVIRCSMHWEEFFGNSYMFYLLKSRLMSSVF